MIDIQLMDSDTLLTEDDLIKPDPTSLTGIIITKPLSAHGTLINYY